MALAKMRQHKLSLADLVKHGRPPLSEKSLLSSANFALSLLPIRLAHRLQALRNLPYIVVSNPNISRIYSTYVHSLSILLPYWRAAAEGRGITTLEDEIKFTNTLAELVATHTDTIPILARGFLECRKYISPAEVTRFLEDAVLSKPGCRNALVCGAHGWMGPGAGHDCSRSVDQRRRFNTVAVLKGPRGCPGSFIP